MSIGEIRYACLGCSRSSEVLVNGAKPRGWFAVRVLPYDLPFLGANWACSADCVEEVKRKSVEYVCDQARGGVYVERVK